MTNKSMGPVKPNKIQKPVRRRTGFVSLFEMSINACCGFSGCSLSTMGDMAFKIRTRYGTARSFERAGGFRLRQTRRTDGLPTLLQSLPHPDELANNEEI